MVMATPSTTASGLTASEVAERVARGEVNAVEQQTSRSLATIIRANVFTRFNAILGTLFVVVLVTGHLQDALFGFVVILNSLIGIVQEYRAKRTLDRLALLNAPVAHARRDGKTIDIAVGEVVLDDIVELKAGDQVPADGTVTEAEGLEIDESLLTGESDAVVKAVSDEVLSGSIVVSGRGAFQAKGVGANSFAQKIAADAKRYTVTKSELTTGINSLLKYLSWCLVVIGPILFWSEFRTNKANWRDAVTGATAGLVGMVPEGLVLLTSLAFLVATVTLARRQTLVQELPAVEGLARVDVVCLDKTGTLTEGEIDYSDLEEFGPPDPEHLDLPAALGALGADPSPNGTLSAIARSFPAPEGWEREASVAFSSARKWSGVTFKERGTWVLGAPEIVLEGHDDGPIRQRANELAKTGRRVLVLARSDETLAGDQLPPVKPLALLMFDERIRPDAAETLAYFTAQGVALKVISGDNPLTVSAVAMRVELPNAEAAIDARELPEEGPELADIIEKNSVFGRVTPQQKRAMVRALQSRGHVVAMTGDGVNDALALKDADIGVAMGSGAAATRAVAQVVLLDGKFSHLPDVVAEGRRVMANVERVASLFVIKNVYSALLALAVSVARLPYPFLPRHLTIVSGLTIGIPAFLFALAPNARRYESGFLRRVLTFSVPTGAIAAVGIFVGYVVARAQNIPRDQARAAATVVVMVIGLWVLVLLARPLAGWKLALVATMGGLFAVAMVTPTGRKQFALAAPTVCLLSSIAIGAGAAALVTLVWKRSTVSRLTPEVVPAQTVNTET